LQENLKARAWQAATPEILEFETQFLQNWCMKYTPVEISENMIGSFKSIQ